MTSINENIEMPQLENCEEAITPETSGSERLRKRQKQNPPAPVIELDPDTDANSQLRTNPNLQKRRIDLNKAADQLVLIPNAKPPGQSWIWGYFDQYKPIAPYRRIVKCLVEVQRKNGIEICGHFMGTDSSTGNFISHLGTHRITEESYRRNMAEMQKRNQLLQPRVDEMMRQIITNNPEIKIRRDRKLAAILIKDNRPISMCNDEGFVEFIHEFDPNYQIPCDKTIQQLLAESYNQIKEVLVAKLKKNVISCSITTDLWTARSRSGYIGVTCSFIDNDFKLCEAILSIQFVPYPHTGNNICGVLREIISNWNLNGKVFTITTDNGSNMVRAGKLMNELVRLPCTAHTLQLVVGKGLLPAEVLIARAKRLINFFTTPKQTEKLMEIQSNCRANSEVTKFFSFISFLS
jgi:hypothetical protein